MTFWSGETIKANTGIVSDFSEDRVDCNSYTIRMGGQYFVTAGKEGTNASKKKLKSGATLVIPPGQFGYLLSKETVTIPSSAMGLISMRTGLKFQGLINVSGFHVDPGYRGLLVLAVYNAGTLPVSISEGEGIFKIWLANLDIGASSILFDGKPPNKITNDLVRGMSREILTLSTLSEKIKSVELKLAEQKPTVDILVFIWRAVILIAVAAGISAIWSVPGAKENFLWYMNWVYEWWTFVIQFVRERIPHSFSGG